MAVHLPPITDIDAMFDDLTSRVSHFFFITGEERN
jgi:hypothetical protein